MIIVNNNTKKQPKKTVTIFYCLPMSGRSDEEITSQIHDECIEISNLIKTISDDVDIEILCNYIDTDREIQFSPMMKHQSLYFLGRGINVKMSRADIVVFGRGWENARGCRIEKAICEEYELKHFCI